MCDTRKELVAVPTKKTKIASIIRARELSKDTNKHTSIVFHDVDIPVILFEP